MNENDEIEVMDQQGNRLKITRGEYARQTMNAARQWWDNLEAMRHFTIQFLQDGFPAQSLEVAERAVELSKGHVRDLYMRAAALAETGRLEESASAFEELREDAAYPADIARATAGLARVRARQERHDEAEALYLEALDIDPDNPAPMTELYAYMSFRERPQVALEKIRALAEKFPRASAPHRALAQIALSAKDIDGMRSAIRMALSRATEAEIGDIYAESSMLLGQAGLPQEIITLLEPRRHEIRQPFALLNLALAYEELGRTSDARDILNGLRATAPPQLQQTIEARLQQLG